MRIKMIIITAFLNIAAFASAFAQNFEGIATYKTDRKVELKMDSTHMNDEIQQQLQAQLRKQFQKEYTLRFNANESLYQEVESLSTPAPSTGGINIILSGNDDVLYRNLKENQYINQTEIMSKIFLITDSLQKDDWKLEKETKNIGNYTCFKATRTREVTEQTFSSDSDSLVNITKNQTTVAWYTLDIPIQHGPSDFWGLPGMILEINDGDQTILCSKIVLNPEKKTKIEAPSKGKKVDQATFDAIEKKKMQEMQEQLQNNSSRKDGDSFHIKIGG